MREPDYNRIKKAEYHLNAIKMILGNIKPENRTKSDNLRIENILRYVFLALMLIEGITSDKDKTE